MKIWKDGTIKIVSEETHNKAKKNLKYALGFAAGSILLFVALVVFTLIQQGGNQPPFFYMKLLQKENEKNV